MELVEGVTIQDRLDHGPVPAPEALDYIFQVLAALSYAHARGVIHRDLKPANMMVTPGGVVKLMDFGIAKAAGDQKLTMTGTTLGSLYYMSPEQIKGGELDARSDLYSLGVALYEIVTGARPFQGDSDFSIMSAHLEKQPVPPIQVDPKLPAALNEIILMSIAKEPAKRFQTADAFRAAVGSVMGEARPAVPAVSTRSAPPPAPVAPMPSAPVAAPPPARSSHRGVYIALGATLAVAALVVGATQLPKWLKTRAGENSAPAQQEQAVPAAQPPAEQTPPTAQPAAAAPTAEPPSAAPARAVQAPSMPPGRVTQPPVRSGPPPSSTAAQTPVAASTSAASPEPAKAAPAADVAKAAALKELQRGWPMLASRAGAVSSSLQGLQQQQQRSGFGLRGDIAASWKRMEHYMDQVEASLAAKDPEAAKENMENAEREVTALEKFLGR
jgi:eukaryotic-like serine/threonine-protein kinase